MLGCIWCFESGATWFFHFSLAQALFQRSKKTTETIPLKMIENIETKLHLDFKYIFHLFCYAFCASVLKFFLYSCFVSSFLCVGNCIVNTHHLKWNDKVTYTQWAKHLVKKARRTSTVRLKKQQQKKVVKRKQVIGRVMLACSIIFVFYALFVGWTSKERLQQAVLTNSFWISCGDYAFNELTTTSFSPLLVSLFSY